MTNWANDLDPTLPAPTRLLRPADLCRLRAVVDVALHPSGRSVVFTVAWPDADTDANRSVLETCELDGRNRRRLTEGHADRQPRFSPDGRRFAFLRSRPKEPTRVAVADWPSGSIVEVASFADGAVDVAWAGDERLVVLAANRPENQQGVADEELARRPRILTRTDYRANGRGWTDRPGQVWVIDEVAEGAEPRPIGPVGIDHGAIAVSPDGRLVAATAAADDDRDLTGDNDVWLLELDPARAGSGSPAGVDGSSGAGVDGSSCAGERAPTPVRLTPPGGSWGDVVWHPDGTLVAIGTADHSIAGFSRPHVVAVPDDDQSSDGADGPATPQSLTGADQHVVTGPAARGAVPVDGGWLFPGARRGRVAVDRHHLDGRNEVVSEGPHQILAFDATPDASIIVGAVTSPARPAELWRLDGEPTRLVGLNDPLLAELELASVEEVVVTSADGTEVHAFVTRPPASAPAPGPGGRPGLLYIHGGPMFQYGLNYFDEFQMAAACGYVVIGGNPRGSDGYGEAWARAIIGDLGNLDFADVTALADHLCADPDVDTERVGIGGGSYGGFMTGWVLARDRRFRAGLVERAVTSWTTMFGTSDIGSWFTERTIGATIESDDDEVRRQSPVTYAADITAPTLIVHSEEDWRCPIEQAEQLFAAIRRNGGQVTMVRFPGENHELSRSGRPSHRVERFEIVHEFFARHLGGAHFGTDHLG